MKIQPQTILLADNQIYKASVVKLTSTCYRYRLKYMEGGAGVVEDEVFVDFYPEAETAFYTDVVKLNLEIITKP